MKTCVLDFSNKICHPIFFLDSEGNNQFMNESGSRFLKHINEDKVEDIINIKELIQECQEIKKDELYSKNIELDKLNMEIEIHVSKIKYIDGISYVIYFEETIYSSKLAKEILNSIDSTIIILDNKGNLIDYNNAAETIAYKELGIYIDEFIGMHINDMLEKGASKEYDIKNLINTQEKNIQSIEFENGKSMIYTSIPVFDEEGELKNRIITGRDIDKLIDIRDKLFSIKKERMLIETSYETIGEDNILVYSSKEMKKVINMAQKVAKTDSQVFITGSSGVGKEELARYIYENSNRADKSFIAMNCAAIPSDLLEMELFGYEEGSFTGAKKGGKKGLLEEANGGTVFLDEIGELPMEMQSKLLRVIQENKFIKTGGTEYIEVDIRYISATNLSQSDLMNNTKFRQDLYYRLSLVPIHLLDLKDRKSDIVALTLHFIKLFNEKYNSNVQIKDNVLNVFREYEWPGNVRQLKNIIERIMILGDGKEVKKSDFYEAINLDFRNEKNISDGECNIEIKDDVTLEEAHMIVDKILIENSIKKYGDVKKASEMLGVNKSTIYRKLEKIKDDNN